MVITSLIALVFVLIIVLVPVLMLLFAEEEVLSPRRQDPKMKENEIGRIIVDSAVHLHQALGPGLLESVYEVTPARELEKRGLRVERQVPVAIAYEGGRFDGGFRADLVVEGEVIIELKSVEHASAAHKKQVLTYLRLTGMKRGFPLNFGEALMKEGITRTINGTLDPDLGVPVTL